MFYACIYWSYSTNVVIGFNPVLTKPTLLMPHHCVFSRYLFLRNTYVVFYVGFNTVYSFTSRSPFFNSLFDACSSKILLMYPNNLIYTYNTLNFSCSLVSMFFTPLILAVFLKIFISYASTLHHNPSLRCTYN